MTDDDVRQIGEMLESTAARVEGRVDELHRHFDVVSEQLDGQIRLVAEGVTIMSQRLDRVEAELQSEIRRESADTRAVFRL